MKTLPPSLVLMIAAMSSLAQAERLGVELRQYVIRAPEMEVIGLTTMDAKTDAEIAAKLWQAVKEGRASLVSDITTAVDDKETTSVTIGRHVRLSTGRDQDFDHLFMPPVSYEEKLAGTSLTYRPLAPASDPFDGTDPFPSRKPQVPGLEVFSRPAGAQWQTAFSPRPPLMVKWPTSWLRSMDGNIREEKIIHGWLDWYDVFEENAGGQVWFDHGNPMLNAVLPPADQVWGSDRKGRWLDVFLTQVQRSPDTQTGAAQPKAPPPPLVRTMTFGIGLPTKEALALTVARDAAQDAALLQKLLSRVQLGKARMHFCAGSGGNECQLLSARMHHYPTEMPSIPSSWAKREVGTSLRSGQGDFWLDQALAPPARSEWRLSEKDPGAILWEPRFRHLQMADALPTGHGAYLIGVLHIPEVMVGDGVPADETILVFAQNQSATPTSAPARHCEAEIMVFAVPANEEAKWQPIGFAEAAADFESQRLQSLCDRVQSGTVSLVSHLHLLAREGIQARASIFEDYMTATEFDPPDSPKGKSIRPTALATLPTGSQWEVDWTGMGSDSMVRLKHAFDQSTAKPVEPSLQDNLAMWAKGKTSSTGAAPYTESWKDEELTLIPGMPRCLGTRKPPGVKAEILHVAFVRMRKLP